MLSLSSSPEPSLHLLTLLLTCADLISSGNFSAATDILPEIISLSSPFSHHPFLRLSAFLSSSLHSHLLSLSLSPPLSPHPHLHTLSLTYQLPKLHSAIHLLNSFTPLIKFSHFTSNQSILQSLPSHSHLHLIDLDIMQGLQWPALFHLLSPLHPLSLRLSAFSPSSHLLSLTAHRLAGFARSLGIPFKFNPLEGKIGNLRDLTLLGIRDSEVTVVHWMQHGLYDVTESDVGTLKVLCAIRPRLITMVEQDINVGNYNRTGSFLGRFVGALHYYSAMFDALGESGLGADSVQRHVVEQQLFGCEIRNILAVGGVKRRIANGGGDRVVGRWRDEIRRIGFESVSLKGSPLDQAGLLLGMFPGKGYTLVEENGCLRLGWKGLPLITASAWQPAGFDST